MEFSLSDVRLSFTGDLPPLILSPSQYHNYTQPRGNFIPYANEDRAQYRSEGRARLSHGHTDMLSQALDVKMLQSCIVPTHAGVTVIGLLNTHHKYHISKYGDKLSCLHILYCQKSKQFLLIYSM